MDYRGELKLRFKRQYRIENIPRAETNNEYTTTSIAWGEEINQYRFNACKWYEVGERIGQIMIIPRPKINFVEVDELAKTERGDGGFGSTNK